MLIWLPTLCSPGSPRAPAIRNMSSKILLRTAVFFLALQAMGHTIGISTWKDEGSPVPPIVMDTMKSHDFAFYGGRGNLATFYDGLGYAATISLLFLMSILWMTSGVKKKNRQMASWFLSPAVAAMILLSIDEILYFFPIAAALTLVSAGLTLAATVMMRKGRV